MKAFRWMKELAPTCRDMTRLQSRALDERLPFAQRLGMRLHLSFCKWCRRYGRQLRFIQDALTREESRLVESSPHRLPDDSRERLKDLLRGS